MVAHKKLQPFFFRSPDLCSEANAVINKSKAKVAWTAIQQGLWQQRRTGTTQAKVASEMNRLVCGFHQLAANEGIDVGTMRRQCRRLAAAGFIRLEEDTPQMVHDQATGRIISRRGKGPAKPVVIVVTVRPEHLKPSNSEEARSRKAALAQSAPIPEVQNAPQPIILEVQNAPTPEVQNAPISENYKELITEQPPDGHADGFGRPQAADGEKDTYGLEAVEDSLEKGDVPALEAIAGPDTDTTPSWGYAISKASRSIQNATGDAKRPWTPKTHTQASGEAKRPRDNEAPTPPKVWIDQYQIAPYRTPHEVQRMADAAAAKRAASELVAALPAIGPAGAKKAAKAFRMAATAGV